MGTDLELTITLAKKVAIIYHSCFIMETLLLHEMASFALVLAMYNKITPLGVPEEFKAINQWQHCSHFGAFHFTIKIFFLQVLRTAAIAILQEGSRNCSNN